MVLEFFHIFPLSKGGYRKSPFVKGDLEGFSSAQHDFDVAHFDLTGRGNRRDFHVK
jgi:hypothetical protein